MKSSIMSDVLGESAWDLWKFGSLSPKGRMRSSIMSNIPGESGPADNSGWRSPQSRIKRSESEHEEPDVTYPSELGPQCLDLGVE